MREGTLLVACAGTLIAVSTAAAQSVDVASVTDAAAAIPGQTFITPAPADAAPADACEGPGSARGMIPQMPGFPITVGRHLAFSPWRGPVFADLDADGDLEILAGGTNGQLHAWHHTGGAVAGFPVATTGGGQYPPSVADMDGDGDPEIVLFTRGLTSGGRIYAFSHTGAVLPGFPVNLNNSNLTGSPTLYDLNSDGTLEIIANQRVYPLGYVHVIGLDGTVWGGNWPVEMDHVPTSTAAVGDLDNDGTPEIFYQSYLSMYLLHPDGTSVAGWPQALSDANFSYQSAAFADLDNDGDREIVTAAHGNTPGVYAFHHNGTSVSGWPQATQTWTYCPPSITDLEGDGALEVIAGQAGVLNPSACFWAWDASGNVKPGFPYMDPGFGGGSEGTITVADIDGDGSMEIFADHNVRVDGIGYLFGVTSTGQTLPGFPLRPVGFTHMSGATIGDVDGDGDYELGVFSFSESSVDVNLYDLPQQYAVNGREWPMYHNSNARGGRYGEAETPCDADFDGSGDLTLADFVAFRNAYVAGDLAADFDQSGDLTLADFVAFRNAYVAGCP